jgi:hypothetical protein
VDACGNAERFPGVPEINRNWPVEAAVPTAQVGTAQPMNCTVSELAIVYTSGWQTSSSISRPSTTMRLSGNRS